MNEGQVGTSASHGIDHVERYLGSHSPPGEPNIGWRRAAFYERAQVAKARGEIRGKKLANEREWGLAEDYNPGKF